MLVINLWGGPGAGKTTTAAGLFYLLRHYWNTNTELVTEFATDLCFERARDNLKNQVYLLGNQHHRLWRLSQIGVQVAVTDAPIGLNDVYSNIYSQKYSPEMHDLIEKISEDFDMVNILMLRDPNAVGGYKGGSKKKDQWFVERFDKALQSDGPVMDFQVRYREEAPHEILERLKMMSSVSGKVKISFWKKENANG